MFGLCLVFIIFVEQNIGVAKLVRRYARKAER